MARLKIHLLGSLEVTLDGQPLSGFESDKVRALLAYLAVESGRSHRREKLAGLLWPDSTEESARTNLRGALSNLRTVLHDRGVPQPALDASAQTVQFDCAGDVWVDVLALQQHLADSRRAPPALGQWPSATSDLQAAVELYRGPFLEGFSLPGNSLLEEWALLEQERVHRLVMEALCCLTGRLEEQGELEQALRYAWRQVELDPWGESGHQQVMRLLARSGQRGAALAQYEACRRSLSRELDAEPSVETTGLYRQIRDQVAGPAAGPGGRGTALSPAGQAGPEEKAAGVAAAPQPQAQRTAAARQRWRLAAGLLALLAIAAVAVMGAARLWRQHSPGGIPGPATPPAGSVSLPQPPADVPTASPWPAAAASLPLTCTLPCQIVLSSTEGQGLQGQISRICVLYGEGQQPALLSGSEERVEESRPLWLPGRQGIVYERFVRSQGVKRYSLWRMHPDGSGRQPLLGDMDARGAALSPDGRQLVFISKRGDAYQLLMANLDGSDVVQLTDDESDCRRPSWSPDGHWLAFDAGAMAPSSIYVIGVDGSGRKQLTSATHDSDAAWSPDGELIAFVSLRDGDAEVYVMSADGSGQTNVSNFPGAEDRDVSWMPDQRLIFASDRDGDWEIYVMNADGSHVVQMTHNDGTDRWPNCK